MAVVSDYVHDADQNCRRTGSKRILRRPHQINIIHNLILSGKYRGMPIFIFYAYLNFAYETLTDIILNDCKYISVYNIFKRIGISRP